MNTNTAKQVTKLTYCETKKPTDGSTVKTRLILWCKDVLEEIIDTDQPANVTPYKRFKKLYNIASERYAAMNGKDPIILVIDTLALSTPYSQAFIRNTASKVAKGISRSKTVTRIGETLLDIEWR